jgi:hypothetical protein
MATNGTIIVPISEYAAAVRNGASNNQLTKIVLSGIGDPWIPNVPRADRALNDEMMDARVAGLDLGEYVEIRRTGLSHPDAVAQMAAEQAAAEKRQWLFDIAAGLGGADAVASGATRTQVVRLAIEACTWPDVPISDRPHDRLGPTPTKLKKHQRESIAYMLSCFTEVREQQIYSPGEIVRSLIRLSQDGILSRYSSMSVHPLGGIVAVRPDFCEDPSGWHALIGIVDRICSITVRCDVVDNHTAWITLSYTASIGGRLETSVFEGTTLERSESPFDDLLSEITEAARSDEEPACFEWLNSAIRASIGGLMRDLEPDPESFDPATFGSALLPDPAASVRTPTSTGTFDDADDF